MILGDNAYDVVQGFVGAPIGSFTDHRKASAEPQDITSDEELLTAFLNAKSA
jgi:hypothetical protein